MYDKTMRGYFNDNNKIYQITINSCPIGTNGEKVGIRC